MDPRHYIAEYDLGVPAECVAGQVSSIDLLPGRS
jgi:hypothetical protein